MAAFNLFRLFTAARSQAKTRRTFRPILEVLDARDVPTVLTWTDATGDDQFMTPGNWNSSDISSGAPQIAVPQPGNDLLYVSTPSGGGGGGGNGITVASGPQGGSPDCYGMQGGPYNSIFVTGGYSGTITVTGPVQTLALEMAAPGIIDQPIVSPDPTQPGGSDISVLGGETTTAANAYLISTLQADFTWAMGTINSTSNLSNIWLQGCTASVNPGGGAVSTGDNINLNNGANATFQPGTVYLTNPSSLVINANCSATMEAPANATVTFNNASIGTPFSSINAGGSLTVQGPGTWAGQGVPLLNNGGTFTIQGGATASFTGALAPATVGASYQQNGTTGLTLIQNGSTLEVANGAYLTDGKLSTFATTNGAQPFATLEGDLIDSGADIVISDDAYNGAEVNGHQYGTFQVTGNVKWSGGVYRPYLGGTNANPLSDMWEIEGTLLVTAGAGFAGVGPVLVGNQSGNSFNILWAQGGATYTAGSPDAPNLALGFTFSTMIPVAGGIEWVITVN